MKNKPTVIEATDFKRDPSKFYAGELREMGVDVAENIPDCAHTPRDSVKFGDVKVTGMTEDEIAEGVVKLNIPVTFTEPFEWVTINLGPKGGPVIDTACELVITDEPLPDGDDLPELHKRLSEEAAAFVEEQTTDNEGGD